MSDSHSSRLCACHAYLLPTYTPSSNVMSMQTYAGRCHCGAIGFYYRTGLAPSRWSIRACQCRFCRAHDALSTSDPGGELQFESTAAETLRRYRFAMKTADFLLCRNCGVYIGASIETPNGRFGIINTHALAAIPEDIAAVQPISYDSEEKSGRVNRRESRWTPVSRVPW